MIALIYYQDEMCSLGRYRLRADFSPKLIIGIRYFERGMLEVKLTLLLPPSFFESVTNL